MTPRPAPRTAPFLLLLIGLLLPGGGGPVATPGLSAQGQERAEDRAEAGLVVVYLVRHAERDDASPTMADPGDPPLSAAGTERAAELVRLLGDVPLATVFTTPFRRTRDTARPVAEHHGLAPVEYDPRLPGEAAATVQRIVGSPGHHLVVGHSNTTPAMVAALGGDPGPPISESEYDRIYMVVIGPGGEVATSRLRFGDPAPGDAAGDGHR